MHLCFIVTRASAMTSTWTTVQMAVVALGLGHHVSFLDRDEISILPDGIIRARVSHFKPQTTTNARIAIALQSRQAKRIYARLSDFDRIILRTRPLPLYLHTLMLIARDHGVPITNDPEGLMRTASKSWLASLSDVAL